MKLKIRDNELEVVKKTKYLGLQIDCSLDWKEQIKAVSAKVSRAIGFLKHAKFFLPKETLQTRSLKRYNKALFQQDLQEIDWHCILASLADEPSKMVTTFQEIFESLLNVHAPLKVKKLRNEFIPWLTSSVRDLGAVAPWCNPLTLQPE